MSLVGLLVFIIVIGVVMWMINKYLPMEQPWKMLLNVIVILVVAIYLLRFAGVV